MDLPGLTKAYFSLSPREQAQFAMTIRAHHVFNRPEWKDEITRRHTEIEAGNYASIESVEAMMRDLDLHTAGEMTAKKIATPPTRPADNPTARDMPSTQ